MVNENEKLNYIATSVIFITTIFTLIVHDFDLDKMSHHTIQALVISCIFSFILAPSMVYFSKAIVQEQFRESKHAYGERDSLVKLFHSM